MDKPVITPLDNGPLFVEAASAEPDAELLRAADGEVVPVSAPFTLCRCGGSSDKPFCDGTHDRVGFDSTNRCDHAKDRVDTYVGAGITVYNNPQLCSISERCVKGLPQVFRRGQKPWCDPDAASPDEIAALIERCPSGALWYSIEGVEHRDFGQEPAITISLNGPYEVAGGVVTEAPDPATVCSHEHYALCRCGASCNKPYCDGSHWEAGFVDETQAQG